MCAYNIFTNRRQMDPKLKDIFDKEKVVFNSLKDYNTAYTNYAMCHSHDQNLKTKANNLGICQGGNNYIELRGKAAVTENTISALSNALNVYNSSTDTDYRKTTNQYDASLAELTSNYRTLLNDRSNLDMRIQDLYNNTNSVSAMNQLETDATVYANILWTILATSLIYFIFIKL